jgi:TRAP-type C4-dicarboxylate transport system substrate-binding protein
MGQRRSKRSQTKAVMNARIYLGRAWVVLTAAVAVGAAACGPGNLDKAGGPVSKPVVLTLANDSGDLSGAQPFATAVSELSHGALQIRIEGPSGRLGDLNSETGLIRAVQAGKAQLGITGTQAFDALAGSFQALEAPFLIDSYALQRKVLASDLSQKMLAALKPAGLVGVGLLPGVLARPFSFSRPLVAASDYRGAKVGIVPSLVARETFRGLGATPVTSGGIAGLDGIETDVFAADTAFHRPGATLTGNVVFWPWPGVIFMNRRAFESLTAGQRSDLFRAAAKARAAKIYLGNDAAYLRDLCRRGTKVVTASPVDLAGLRVAVRPVYRALEANPTTRGFLNAITTMRQAMGGSPDSLTCASVRNIGQGSTSASPLEGTWQVTYTKRELLAAGANPTQIYLSEETWGHFSLKLSSGHWWLRLTGGDRAVPPNYRLAYGTYVVAGNKGLFDRRDHDYLGSGTEVWGPYIWSVYRGTLTFKRDGWTGSTQGPAGLVVKPWRKNGT